MKKSNYGAGWIHPSIRDLVIEHLISVKPERQSFLSVCSLNGISLTLSVGGGTEGTRNFPLIVSTEDMNIVRARISELIQELPSDQITGLMRIISESKVKSSELGKAELTSFIDDLFEITLDHVIERFSKEQEALDNETFELYFQMSALSKTYRPSLPLEVTWKKRILRLHQALEKAESDGYIDDLPEFRAIFKFVDLIKENDPRFLRFINYPSCLSKYTSKFIELCIKEAESDYSLSGDDLYDIYIGESQKYDDLGGIAENLSRLGCDIETDKALEEVLVMLEREKENWEEQAYEYYSPEPDYDGTGSSSKGVSIESIFSDL